MTVERPRWLLEQAGRLFIPSVSDPEGKQEWEESVRPLECADTHISEGFSLLLPLPQTATSLQLRPSPLDGTGNQQSTAEEED